MLGMPLLLKVLSVVGTAAMLWVGGGIIIHGLEAFGFATLGHAVHDVAAAAGHAAPALSGLTEWLVSAAASGVFGLVIGALLIPLVQYVVAPLLKRLRGSGRKAAEPSH